MANNTYDPTYYSVLAHAMKLNREAADKDMVSQPPPLMTPEATAYWNAQPPPGAVQPIPPPMQPVPQPPQLPPQLQEQLQQHMQQTLPQNQLEQLLILLQQQQREIKEQQQQQQKKAAASNVIFHTFIGAREVELLIREFNPSKDSDLYAAEWIREIELLGKIYKWDPYLLMMYGSMRLGGVAKTWYKYSLESITDWDDFKRELVNNFPRSVDSADVLSKLIAKKRQSNESLEEYFHDIVKMGKSIKLPDETIKEYLIRGLEQPKDQIVLSSIGPCSLTEFLQHMQRLEKELKKTPSAAVVSDPPVARKRSRSRSAERSAVRSRQESRSPSKESTRNPEKHRSRKCLECGSTEHFLFECPNLRKSNERDSRSDRRRESRFDSKPPLKFELRSNVKTIKAVVRMCRICKTEHDIEANCPVKARLAPERKPLRQPRKCYNCRKEGHNVADCPEKRTRVEESEERPRKLWRSIEEKGKQDDAASLEDYERDEMNLMIDLGEEGDNAEEVN